MLKYRDEFLLVLQFIVACCIYSSLFIVMKAQALALRSLLCPMSFPNVADQLLIYVVVFSIMFCYTFIMLAWQLTHYFSSVHLTFSLFYQYEMFHPLFPLYKNFKCLFLMLTVSIILLVFSLKHRCRSHIQPVVLSASSHRTKVLLPPSSSSSLTLSSISAIQEIIEP